RGLRQLFHRRSHAANVVGSGRGPPDRISFLPLSRWRGVSQRARLSSARASLAALVLGLVVVCARHAIADAPLTVKITSPLGRTGTPGAVRIVARVQVPAGVTLSPVRFLIDGALYKTKDDGAPYVVEWVDENPFERHEIKVEARDSAGHAATDV